MKRLTDGCMYSHVLIRGGKVALAIHQCSKPTIAAINGSAVGGKMATRKRRSFTDESQLGLR
jgi:enoyl-CoA hydratase/carnithine racemase